MAEPLPPSPEDLAAELATTLRGGITTQALRDCPRILGLAVLAAKAASTDTDDLTVAAEGAIREAAIRADGYTDGPASTLLALAQGTRGSLLKSRRQAAAKLLHVNTDHFRKHREEPLIEAIAGELYATNSAWRLRHRLCRGTRKVVIISHDERLESVLGIKIEVVI